MQSVKIFCDEFFTISKKLRFAEAEYAMYLILPCYLVILSAPQLVQVS